MAEAKQPQLEVGEDLAQQRREWRVQRIAWVVLYLILFAVALGAMGKGPLSERRLESPDGTLRLEYERFLRYQSPDTLRVRVQAPGEELHLRLASGYLRDVELQTIMPRPKRVVAGKDEVALVFDTTPMAWIDVQLSMRPSKTGSLDGWIQGDGGQRLSFQQFVYP